MHSPFYKINSLLLSDLSSITLEIFTNLFTLQLLLMITTPTEILVVITSTCLLSSMASPPFTLYGILLATNMLVTPTYLSMLHLGLITELKLIALFLTTLSTLLTFTMVTSKNGLLKVILTLLTLCMLLSLMDKKKLIKLIRI